MKNKYIIFLLSVVVCSLSIAQTTKKVAFLGNSYTYYNDLPSLIDSLANNQNNDLIHGQNTPGGYTFNGHSTNAASLALLTSNTWDYVVLQEQSQLPAFPYSQVITDCYPYAETLCDSIRSANECAIPLFFNTWGREIGDPQWDSIDTYIEMNDRLFNGYTYMATANSGKVSPVGFAFREVFNDLNAIVTHGMLYSPDGSHPSLLGSYLAACVFNNVIFNTNSLGINYLPTGVTIGQAAYLQQVADNVLNASSNPIFDFTSPIADFTSTKNLNQVTFSNSSLHAFEYEWDFGDNTTSTLENPIHTYAANGTYTVKLTALYCGGIDIMTQTITIENLSVKKEKIEVSIYPNPVNDEINIKVNNGISLEIFNTMGVLIYKVPVKNTIMTFDLSNQPSGVYFVKVSTETGVLTKRVVKK